METENNNLLTLLRNKALLIVVAVIVIAILIVLAAVLPKKEKSTDTSSNLVEDVFDEASDDSFSDNLSANLLANVVESGKGEAVFVLSAKKDSIVREIQLYNPHKNSWVVIYDGYKSVSQTPVEVYRAQLAAIDYSKVQVRALDNFYFFEQIISVPSGGSLTVNLEI